MDTVVHFLALERAQLREAAVDKEAAEAAAAAGVAGGPDAGKATPAAPSAGLQLDYQRKVTPSDRAVLLADVLDDAYEAAQGECSELLRGPSTQLCKSRCNGAIMQCTRAL
jgi:hypothetical protein